MSWGAGPNYGEWRTWQADYLMAQIAHIAAKTAQTARVAVSTAILVKWAIWPQQL